MKKNVKLTKIIFYSKKFEKEFKKYIKDFYIVLRRKNIFYSILGLDQVFWLFGKKLNQVVTNHEDYLGVFALLNRDGSTYSDTFFTNAYIETADGTVSLN
jgi:hypothetical protein